ncbi:MAG: zinc ribbon domain-containing protein [Pseudomonadota bacterium]
MPLYEFECNKCKHSFDKVLSLKDMDTLKLVCPACGSDDVKKLLSSGGIKMGPGWHAGKIK